MFLHQLLKNFASDSFAYIIEFCLFFSLKKKKMKQLNERGRIVMDDILQIVIIVFMLFLCILCLFAVIVILRDVLLESARNRRELKESKRQEPIPTTPVTPEPSIEKTPAAPLVVEPEPVVEETPVDDNSVVFSSNVQSMEERYAALSSEFKRYFDDIVRHVLSKEGVKVLKHTSSYDYKDGAYRILRLMIKRSEIVCEFHFIDRDFKNYANTSNVKMKQSATTIRVSDAAGVGAVKDGIDLVCSQIAEDRDYKKQLAKEKRRARQKRNQEAKNSMDETVNV